MNGRTASRYSIVNLIALIFISTQVIKGTVDVLSSDPTFIQWHVRSTTVPFLTKCYIDRYPPCSLWKLFFFNCGFCIHSDLMWNSVSKTMKDIVRISPAVFLGHFISHSLLNSVTIIVSNLFKGSLLHSFW